MHLQHLWWFTVLWSPLPALVTVDQVCHHSVHEHPLLTVGPQPRETICFHARRQSSPAKLICDK